MSALQVLVMLVGLVILAITAPREVPLPSKSPALLARSDLLQAERNQRTAANAPQGIIVRLRELQLRVSVLWAFTAP